MVRNISAGLGALTILAVTGAMTTSGHSLLGLGQTSQSTSDVTVIKDAPAPAVTPAPSGLTAGPVPAALPHPAAAPASHAASAPPGAAGPGGAGAGLGPAASIANILLNLPQVLRPGPPTQDEGHGPPPWAKGPKAKKHRPDFPDEIQDRER